MVGHAVDEIFLKDVPAFIDDKTHTEAVAQLKESGETSRKPIGFLVAILYPYNQSMIKIPPYEIIRGSRRSISIQISNSNGLVVRAPFSIPEDVIHEFIERKSDWINKHLRIQMEQQEQRDDKLYYLGKSCTFEYNLLQQEAIIYSEGFFTFSRKIKESGSEKEALAIWYRKQAKKYMNERVQYISGKHNLRYKNIHITSALTRWGSCSGQDNLNFPWRLIMAPTEVIDYVIVHELAHTVHKNHSTAFWGLVSSIMPEWKIYRAHLLENGWKYSLTKSSFNP